MSELAHWTDLLTRMLNLLHAWTHLCSPQKSDHKMKTGLRDRKTFTSGSPRPFLPERRISRYKDRTLPLVLATPSADIACREADVASKPPLTTRNHLCTRCLQICMVALGIGRCGHHLVRASAGCPHLCCDNVAEDRLSLDLRESCHFHHRLNTPVHMLSNV